MGIRPVCKNEAIFYSVNFWGDRYHYHRTSARISGLKREEALFVKEENLLAQPDEARFATYVDNLGILEEKSIKNM